MFDVECKCNQSINPSIEPTLTSLLSLAGVGRADKSLVICNYSEVFSVQIVSNCSIAHTKPNSSNSFTENFSSRKFRNLEAYAFATQTVSVFCSNAAANPNLGASHSTRVSKCWLKCLFSVISDISFKIF